MEMPKRSGLTILTQAAMAVALPAWGSAEDAGTRSSAAHASLGIQGGWYLPVIGAGLESSCISATQNLQTSDTAQ